MYNDKFILGANQSLRIQKAMERSGLWTPKLIQTATSKDNMHLFAQFLHGHSEIRSKENKWEEWLSVTIGIGPKSGEEFVEKSNDESTPFCMNAAAEYMFCESRLHGSKFEVSSEEKTLSLGCATAIEITGKKKSSLKEIFVGIKRRGGKESPAEVGPQLAIQHGPGLASRGKDFLIAMDPIPGNYKEDFLFILKNDNYDEKKSIQLSGRSMRNSTKSAVGMNDLCIFVIE